VKYRSDTVGSPYTSLYTRVYCSAASFDAPYGEIGVVGCSSSYGRYVGFPYTLDDEALTTRSTSLSRAASSTLSVPSTLYEFTFRALYARSDTRLPGLMINNIRVGDEVVEEVDVGHGSSDQLVAPDEDSAASRPASTLCSLIPRS